MLLDVISIGLNKFANKTDVLSLAHEYGDDIELQEQSHNDISYIDLYVKKSDMTAMLKAAVSERLASLILNDYKDAMFNRVISANYFYFTPSEKKEILQKAVSYLNHKRSDGVYNHKLKNIIYNKLREYFEGENEIIVDGFVAFRLNDYKREMEGIIDRAVDDYLIDREYKEFVSLLKYFISLQPSLFNKINVAADEAGNYTLFDDEGNVVRVDFIDELNCDYLCHDLTGDDLLISRLITIAPKSLTVHNREYIKNKELLNTMLNIFESKMTFCGGCELCAPENGFIQ